MFQFQFEQRELNLQENFDVYPFPNMNLTIFHFPHLYNTVLIKYSDLKFVKKEKKSSGDISMRGVPAEISQCTSGQKIGVTQNSSVEGLTARSKKVAKINQDFVKLFLPKKSKTISPPQETPP